MPDWFDQNAPSAAAAASSPAGDWFAANAPSAGAPSSSQGSAVGRFLRGAGEMLNPITMVEGIGHSIAHPIDTVGALVGAQVGEARKAVDNAKQGRIWDTIGHGAAALLPVLGPTAANIGEQIGSGDIAGGLGKAVGLIAPLAVGAAVPESVSVPGALRNPNAIAADAAEFGLKNGVSVDAATASGNRFLRAVQHVSDRSLGGSLIADKAIQAQGEGLATLGEQLAAKGYQTPVTAEQAGEGVRDAVTGNIKASSATADASYNVLRKIEANPAHARPVKMADGSVQLMPLPVDLQPARAAFEPVYRELLRQANITPAAMMGDKARALQALDKIMNGPTHAPLSTVDGLLSDLKSFTRTDVPELRSAGQGAVSEAVKHLDAAVRQTAQNAGPLAEAALRTGRTATIAKYGSADVLDALHAEPVRTLQRLTARKDTGIELLRDVAQQAPGELPKIGRAYLDDLLSKATTEGAFGHAKAIAKSWEDLGPQTKLALYKDPGYVKDLDRFFQLAKMSADTPNASGTAHTALAAVQGGWLFTEPITGTAVQVGAAALSKLLHSPAGVRFLTKGMAVPLKNKVAAAAWATDFTNMMNGATSPSGSRTPDLAVSR